MALLVFGTLWGWLLLRPQVDLPQYLNDLLFIILGHYFAVRGRTSSDAEPGPPPLYLPRGSVRLLLVAGFVATAVLLHRQGRLLAHGDEPKLVGAPALPVRLRIPSIEASPLDEAARLHLEIAVVAQVALHRERCVCAVCAGGHRDGATAFVDQRARGDVLPAPRLPLPMVRPVALSSVPATLRLLAPIELPDSSICNDPRLQTARDADRRAVEQAQRALHRGEPGERTVGIDVALAVGHGSPPCRPRRRQSS